MRENSNSGLVAGGLLGILLLAGCATPAPPPPSTETPYARVVATDIRGRKIAEYVAEGKVSKTEEGTAFRAVERRVFSPKPMLIRYPLGRPVTVKAPNLLITPTQKPGWLVYLDRK